MKLLIAIAIVMTVSMTTLAAAQPVHRPEELGPWIDAGDPRAVPIILERLRETERRSADDATDRYYMTGMIQHAAMYRLEEAGPLMVKLYEQAKDDATELDVVAHCAARYRSESARGLQRSLVVDPRLKNADLRVELLAALAEAGDDKAADALADWTISELARSAIDHTVTYSLIDVIPTVRSKRFVDRINAVPLPPEPAPDEQPKKASELKRARDNLLKLRERLARASSPAESLIDFVGTGTKDDVHSVDLAFTVLMRIGEPKHLAALEAVRLGKDRCLENDDRIIARRDDTIAAIKRHHWREIAEATLTTQP